jgi:hypothetical protein
VKLYHESQISGKQLRPGDYTIKVKDGMAQITGFRQKVEAPVKVETGDTKYKDTQIRYVNAGSTMDVQEIKVGRTNTRLTFADTSVSSLR